MSLGSSPGSAGTIAIVVGVVVVSWLITLVAGSYGHWLFVLAGIGVGLLAVKSISR